MENFRIMVVLDERRWTLGILHLACAVARSSGYSLVLLKMVKVRQPLLLGTDPGYVDFTPEEQVGVKEYSLVAASYGVCFEVCIFQYSNYIPAMVQAAEQFEAAIVFVAPPHKLIPLWQRLQIWWLKKALARHHRTAYVLEQPEDAIKWVPLITLPSKPDPMLES